MVSNHGRSLTAGLKITLKQLPKPDEPSQIVPGTRVRRHLSKLRNSPPVGEGGASARSPATRALARRVRGKH